MDLNTIYDYSNDIQVKVAVEVLLLHLISAYPMFMNPPNQFIEESLGIEPSMAEIGF